MRLSVALLFLIIPLGNLAAEQPTGPTQQTKVFPLANVPAKAAADAIENYLNAKRTLEKLQDPTKEHSKFTITPNIDPNHLMIKATEHDLDEIKTIIKELDQSPDEIVIDLVVSQTTPDGKTVILSRPQARTLNGGKTILEFGSCDSRQTRLTIELNPRVIRGNNKIK